LCLANRQDYNASFFETTIRILGGLLGAFQLSGDELYLDKAAALGRRLYPAFNTPTGIPYSSINLKTYRFSYYYFYIASIGYQPLTASRWLLLLVDSTRAVAKARTHHGPAVPICSRSLEG
jgi:hypothetical protein